MFLLWKCRDDVTLSSQFMKWFKLFQQNLIVTTSERIKIILWIIINVFYLFNNLHLLSINNFHV